MRNRKNSAIPEPIAQLQRQLDQFRSTQSTRTKLPESLWQAAVELARQHGVYSVARPLRLGDLFMSLIHTAELCGANPFDYLTQLQRRAGELATAPAQWMPWNYRQALEIGVPWIPSSVG